MKNNGTLALKFKFVIAGIVGDAKLLEAIDFTYKANGTDYDMTKEYELLAGQSTEPSPLARTQAAQEILSSIQPAVMS